MNSINITVEGASEEETRRYREVLMALIKCGGLTGVKGGKTIIHFDGDGEFIKIQLDYYPWIRRIHG